jgi:hypothetical protein
MHAENRLKTALARESSGACHRPGPAGGGAARNPTPP